MKVCLIRLDKIGDLVCSLPVDEVPWLKGHDVRWVISRGLAFVASNAVPGRRFLQLDRMKWLEGMRALRKFLREERFDLAVSLQAPWWVSLALWLERVPVRGGVKSQWHTFLFLNKGLRQKRSRADRHEADYNLEVVAHALDKRAGEIPAQHSFTNILVEGEKILSTRHNTTRAPRLKMRFPETPDLNDRLRLPPNSYLVVHPGMAGSALNWPQKNYVSLIRTLAEKHTIVITGTAADEPYLGEIAAGLQGNETVVWLVGQLTPVELLAVLGHAKAVIAPSTGVAHLAAALGKSVLCFFSPKRVQRAVRWAPRADRVVCLTPAREDADSGTDGGMEKITPEFALGELAKWGL